MTQPPPDQQPTQHAPQQRPSLEKGAPGPQPPQPPVPPVAPGPQQPQQQWPVTPPPNPYGSGGYPPYGTGPGYGPGPGHGGPVPPSGGGSGKAIAIIIGAIVLVVLLFCGGIIAAIAVIANNVEDSIDDWDPERTGGRDNPISVEVGEGFEIDGVEYDDGWRIQPPEDEYGGETIVDLKGTNERSDGSSEYAYLTFTFVDAADLEVGQITCSSDGPIAEGNSELLECTSYERLSGAYDSIEVSAS